MTRRIIQLGEMIWQRECVAWLWPRFSKDALLTRSCAPPPLLYCAWLSDWHPQAAPHPRSRSPPWLQHMQRIAAGQREPQEVQEGERGELSVHCIIKVVRFTRLSKIGGGYFSKLWPQMKQKNKVVLFKSCGFYLASSDSLGGQQGFQKSAQMKWNNENAYYRSHLAVTAGKVFVLLYCFSFIVICVSATSYLVHFLPVLSVLITKILCFKERTDYRRNRRDLYASSYAKRNLIH